MELKITLTPPAPVDRNIYVMTKEEREEVGIVDLTCNISRALETLKANEVIVAALGEHLLNTSLKQKKLSGICSVQLVHQWERDQYMSMY